jgi:hypothetical protein
MRRLLRTYAVVLGLMLAGSAGLAAQNSAPQQRKELVIGVVLDSNYARIANFLPRLRNSLVKTVPHRRKDVRLVALDSSVQDAEDMVKAKSCDYLLQMNVLEITGGGIGFSTRLPSRDISPEEERERRELGWVRIDYRLKALGDADFNDADTDYVRFLDYPTSWDALAFETTVFRSVTRVAQAIIDRLPKS